jgi:hypothetical protein
MHTNYRITQLCKQNGIATFPMGWVAASSSNEGSWFGSRFPLFFNPLNQQLHELAILWNKTRDEKYRKAWYEAVRKVYG